MSPYVTSFFGAGRTAPFGTGVLRTGVDETAGAAFAAAGAGVAGFFAGAGAGLTGFFAILHLHSSRFDYFQIESTTIKDCGRSTVSDLTDGIVKFKLSDLNIRHLNPKTTVKPAISKILPLPKLIPHPRGPGPRQP
jgi:hypothetical protein